MWLSRGSIANAGVVSLEVSVFKKSMLEKAFLDAFSLHCSPDSVEKIADAVFETGLERPYACALDLIGLYAANLRNGGSPAGPNSTSLGEMTKWSIEKAGFISDGRLIRFNRKEFASLAAMFVEAHPLSKSGGEHNTLILKKIANGDEAGLQRKLLYRIILSIEAFSTFFIKNYQGSASIFSSQFLLPIGDFDAHTKVLEVSRFRSRLLRELKFPLTGPAISANFLKDSQVGLAKTQKNLEEIYLGTLAKPDMHVMRLMLAITGRVSVDSEAALKKLCFEAEFLRLYKQLQPSPSWPKWPEKLCSEDRCMHDLNYMAFSHDYSSLFADRILFVTGSGRSGLITDPSEGGQISRYRKFIASLGLLAPPQNLWVGES